MLYKLFYYYYYYYHNNTILSVVFGTFELGLVILFDVHTITYVRQRFPTSCPKSVHSLKFQVNKFYRAARNQREKRMKKFHCTKLIDLSTKFMNKIMCSILSIDKFQYTSIF